jgi:hypothetical protein
MSTSTDVSKLVHGLNTLLRHEEEFDAATRELFWRSHIEACAAWSKRFSELLLRSPDADPPEDAVLRMTGTGHVAGAREWALLLIEMDTVLLGVTGYTPETASHNADCRRALCFSNIQDYIRTSSSKGFTPAWLERVYEECLKAIGLTPANRETRYNEVYSKLNQSLIGAITLSSDDLEALAAVRRDTATLRGPSFVEGCIRVPPFILMLLEDIATWANEGGPLTVELSERKRLALARIIHRGVTGGARAGQGEAPPGIRD